MDEHAFATYFDVHQGYRVEVYGGSGKVRGICVWVKMKPPRIGPQVLVLCSIYQDSILGTMFLPTAI